MNYYRRYIGNYLKKTSRLTMLEHGAYSLLLDHYYAEEGPLPLVVDEIYIMVRAMTDADRAAVDKVLARYFTLEPDGYHNARADEEIATAQPAIQASRDNGSRGGRPRKDNPTETQRVLGLDTQNETHEEPTGGHPPTTNHQPPTTNHQPPRKERRVAALPIAERVIGHLNEKAGTAFRLVESHLNLVIDRILLDGATEGELTGVIDLKAREWRGNHEMQHCLRPSTLFRKSNYANYVGQIAVRPVAGVTQREQGNMEIARNWAKNNGGTSDGK